MPTVPENSLRDMVYVPMPSLANTPHADSTTHVKGFWIDRYELTNKEFEKFDPSHKRHRGSVSSEDTHPAIHVTWDDAIAYCRWRCKQENVPEGTYRLPTEDEWEYAARGGLSGAPYPWGSMPPYANDIPRANLKHAPNGTTDTFAYTSSVNAFPPNGFGIYGMAGNVAEWCHNLYSNSGPKRYAIRGGSWGTPAEDFTLTIRNGMSPEHWLDNLGFRCIRTL